MKRVPPLQHSSLMGVRLHSCTFWKNTRSRDAARTRSAGRNQVKQWINDELEENPSNCG